MIITVTAAHRGAEFGGAAFDVIRYTHQSPTPKGWARRSYGVWRLFPGEVKVPPIKRPPLYGRVQRRRWR